MTSDAQAVEDGLVGYHREERPLVLERVNAAVWGNTRQGSRSGLIGKQGAGSWLMGVFLCEGSRKEEII